MARGKQNLGSVFAGEDDSVATLEPKTTKAVKAAKVEEEKRIWIVLEENDNIPPTGQFISVNGRAFMLKPGEEALVPECIVNALNDAVQHSPQLDPSTQQVIGYRRKLRFPYRMLAGPTGA